MVIMILLSRQMQLKFNNGVQLRGVLGPNQTFPMEIFYENS